MSFVFCVRPLQLLADGHSCSCSLFVPTRKRLIWPKTLAARRCGTAFTTKLCLFCAYKNPMKICKLVKRLGVPDGI